MAAKATILQIYFELLNQMANWLKTSLEVLRWLVDKKQLKYFRSWYKIAAILKIYF